MCRVAIRFALTFVVFPPAHSFLSERRSATCDAAAAVVSFACADAEARTYFSLFGETSSLSRRVRCMLPRRTAGVPTALVPPFGCAHYLRHRTAARANIHHILPRISNDVACATTVVTLYHYRCGLRASDMASLPASITAAAVFVKVTFIPLPSVLRLFLLACLPAANVLLPPASDITSTPVRLRGVPSAVRTVSSRCLPRQPRPAGGAVDLRRYGRGRLSSGVDNLPPSWRRPVCDVSPLDAALRGTRWRLHLTRLHLYVLRYYAGTICISVRSSLTVLTFLQLFSLYNFSAFPLAAMQDGAWRDCRHMYLNRRCTSRCLLAFNATL